MSGFGFEPTGRWFDCQHQAGRENCRFCTAKDAPARPSATKVNPIVPTKKELPVRAVFLCKIRHNFVQEEEAFGAKDVSSDKKTAAGAAVFSTIFVHCRSSRKMIADTIANTGRSRRQLLNISFMPSSG